jgi:hypothetical protein
LAQLALTLTEYASSSVGPDYDHVDNNRGPCYTGGAQDIKSAVEVSDVELAVHTLSVRRNTVVILSMRSFLLMNVFVIFKTHFLFCLCSPTTETFEM